jgi:hypothetical protein
MSNETFNPAEARAIAARSGLLMGALWTGSFLASIHSFDYPMLGHLGNLMALLSIVVLASILRSYGRHHTGFTFLRRWWTAWNTCMYGSLITTLGQYLYFRFLDGGHLMQSVTRMLEKPEFREALESVSPGTDPTQMLEALEQMNTGDMIVSLLTFNLLASLLASVVAALFSPTHPVREEGETNNPQQDGTPPSRGE